MRYRSYHKEIEYATAQFFDIFNDIVIDRRDSKNNVQKLIKVPCLYGSRSRVLKSLENREKNVKLPLIVVNMESISKDNARVHSIHDGLLYQTGNSQDLLKNTPVPINIVYNVEIITKFQQDMDMIIGNFIPFFNPDVYVVVPHPIYKGQMQKPQIVWNGHIGLDLPDTIGKNEPARIIATTSFTFKTWIHPGMNEYDPNADNIIRRINFNPCIGYDEDGIGRLQGWFAVPTYDPETKMPMSFEKYKQSIICGYIDSQFTDQLQISGGVSGYWHDISALCTGDVLDIHISGDPMYLVTNTSGMLFVSDHCYISQGMAQLSLADYINYYNSTVSGELSGYQGVEACYTQPLVSG